MLVPETPSRCTGCSVHHLLIVVVLGTTVAMYFLSALTQVTAMKTQFEFVTEFKLCVLWEMRKNTLKQQHSGYLLMTLMHWLSSCHSFHTNSICHLLVEYNIKVLQKLYALLYCSGTWVFSEMNKKMIE